MRQLTTAQFFASRPLLRAALATSVLALALAGPAMAQTVPSVPTLTAFGNGSASAAPDIAVVTLGVVSEAASAKEALSANAADMTAVVKSITDAGVDKKDVATTGLFVEPVYSDASRTADGQSKITGYRVSNQLTVKIRDLAASGPLLDKVIAAGANSVNGITFEIGKADALRDEAIKAAIVEARRKAELMAAAAGVKLGAVQSVSANDNGGPQPVFRAAMAMKDMAATPVMGGTQEIGANATIVYAIEPK
ncbi:SIMPL domain-containing protein [Kaistia algarum]|uniref:SIMPL domain-containing protein n=1 Tax=Kaistia algarum TaxID=2083279 RepID=UPI001403D280|nr:SIMPL domain-containing protein [Kaistia algarum]MCX5515714.1 SIMPL domain-containing protein [Kaistia algarum]